MMGTTIAAHDMGSCAQLRCRSSKWSWVERTIFGFRIGIHRKGREHLQKDGLIKLFFREKFDHENVHLQTQEYYQKIFLNKRVLQKTFKPTPTMQGHSRHTAKECVNRACSKKVT